MDNISAITLENEPTKKETEGEREREKDSKSVLILFMICLLHEHFKLQSIAPVYIQQSSLTHVFLEERCEQRKIIVSTHTHTLEIIPKKKNGMIEIDNGTGSVNPYICIVQPNKINENKTLFS